MGIPIYLVSQRVQPGFHLFVRQFIPLLLQAITFRDLLHHLQASVSNHLFLVLLQKLLLLTLLTDLVLIQQKVLHFVHRQVHLIVHQKCLHFLQL